MGKQFNELYYLASDQNYKLTNHVSRYTNLWHQRLGRPSHGPLRVLTKNVLEMMYDSYHICYIFALAKQTRLSFPLSSTTSFDLIYCAIWGPHQVNSYSKAHYFLKIIDDFSRYI